jgi:hypothetical protein
MGNKRFGYDSSYGGMEAHVTTAVVGVWSVRLRHYLWRNERPDYDSSYGRLEVQL